MTGFHRPTCCLLVALLAAVAASPARADSIEVTFAPPYLAYSHQHGVNVLQVNRANDIDIWVYDSLTGQMRPYERLRIWADAGAFIDGQGQAATLTARHDGRATARWTIQRDAGPVHFYVRLAGDPPSTIRDTLTVTLIPPRIEEEKSAGSSSTFTAEHGEICDLGLDLSAIDLICDWGGEKRRYLVDSTASPALAYMQVGDVRDFTYRLDIVNHTCSTCDGCSLYSTDYNCAVCYLSQQNCNGWVGYEKLRFSASS